MGCMIVSKVYDDFNKPPKVPMLKCGHEQKESLSDALTSAATAVAKVFSPSHKNSDPLKANFYPVGRLIFD